MRKVTIMGVSKQLGIELKPWQLDYVFVHYYGRPDRSFVGPVSDRIQRLSLMASIEHAATLENPAKSDRRVLMFDETTDA